MSEGANVLHSRVPIMLHRWDILAHQIRQSDIWLESEISI